MQMIQAGVSESNRMSIAVSAVAVTVGDRKIFNYCIKCICKSRTALKYKFIHKIRRTTFYSIINPFIFRICLPGERESEVGETLLVVYFLMPGNLSCSALLYNWGNEELQLPFIQKGRKQESINFDILLKWKLTLSFLKHFSE